MKFKPGDKVIFLNEKGGGVVTQIISDKVVKVSIEDGFEIPYAVTDLLKAEGSNLASVAVETEEANPDLVPLYLSSTGTGRHKAGAFIAMVPSNQDKPLEGDLEFWLVNFSDYEMLFAVFQNRSGNYHGIEYGYVKANSALFLQEVGRPHLDHWKNGMLQAVYFRAGKTETLKPVSAPIEFKPVRTYQEESFLFESMLQKKAILIPLGSVTAQNQDPGEIAIHADNIKQLQEKLYEGNARPLPEKKVSSFLDKHKVDDKIAEVDLHITELVESTVGMSNSDMLNLQMDYFKKCMDQALVEKLYKVIFIHGIGNGILKNELHRYLRGITEVQFYDASYARYGRGATEVVFFRNQ